MKYTIQNGVERRSLARINESSRFLIPLLVILAGVLLFMLFPTHSRKPSTKPLTLGIYTIKTGNQNGPSKPGDKKNGDKGGSSDLSGGGQNQGLNPQTGGFSPLAAVAPPGSTSSYTGSYSGTTPIGGMGGGSPTSTVPSTGGSTPTGGGGSVLPPPPPPPPVSSPTVVCTDLLTLSQLCTACSPPLLLQPGQKALLYTDGTCVAVN